MLKIRLLFNQKEFEYDLYSLVKAFYPGSEVKITYTEDLFLEDEDFDLTYEVNYGETSYRFALTEVRNGDCLFQVEEPLKGETDRKELKNILKRMVYQALSQQTGRSLPWGNLTGIRPTKIAMGLLEEGWKNSDIAIHMRNTYFTSPAKTALALATANREKHLLADMDPLSGYSLYVGIPFCTSICLYCSFGSHSMKQWGKRMPEYLETLAKELRFIATEMKGRRLDSIYVGGGTPTILEPDQIRFLLNVITGEFPLQDVKEFTFEAGRPDTITEEKLKALKEYPVSRISINPQTMNQKTLDLIGRRHTVEETRQAFALARSLGFDNINMDLIVGLPGEGEKEVRYTLDRIKELDPDSLTIHSLALKRGTRLHLLLEEYQDISFDNSEKIMQMTEQAAMEMGMGPYYLYRQKNIAGNFENVGYSKEGKAGLYNILIMEEKQTILAAGAGASTKFVFEGGKRIERVENVKDLKNYMERIDEMLLRKKKGMELYLE